MKKDLIVAALCSAVGVFVIIASNEFPTSVGDVPGPRVFPLIISFIFIITSALLVISSIGKRVYNRNSQPDHQNEAADDHAKNSTTYIYMALVVAYLVAAGVVGFISITILFLYISMTFFGYGGFLKKSLVSVVIAVSVYCIFRFLLNVPIDFGFFI